jgi:hypothetical protein
MTVEAIKDEIEHLSPEGKAALTAWIAEQDLMSWDEQMETDFSPGGAGMALLEAVDAEFREGRVMPMEDVLADLGLMLRTKPPVPMREVSRRSPVSSSPR